MFLVGRPSPATIERFLRDGLDLPLSYGPPGLLDRQASGWFADETTAVVGHGPAELDRARAALATWAQFRVGWVELHPRDAPISRGTSVAVLIRHLGLWSLNGCRVIRQIGGGDDGDRFGLVYGTLTSHAESGEESFEVLLEPGTNDVVYRIRARSRPRAALTWIGQPVVRMLQARFRADSVEAMRRATRVSPIE